MKLLAPKRKQIQALPVLAMRSSVLFPHMSAPVFVNRTEDTTAVRAAMAADRRLLAVVQLDPEGPASSENIADIGVIARIANMIKLPDGSIRVLLECSNRARPTTVHTDGYISAAYEEPQSLRPGDDEVARYVKTIQRSFLEYARMQRRVPKDARRKVENSDSAEAIVDIVGGTVGFNTDDKLRILSELDVVERAGLVAELLQSEIELLELKVEIDKRVQTRMEKHQKEYYLHEQIKEINRELGTSDDDPSGIKQLEERLEEGEYPETVRERVTKEITRLKKLQPLAPEAGIIRTYVELIVELPWNIRTDHRIDIHRAREILDRDHYDLEKPKERVLEFIAVQHLNAQLKGPILCFVGPPGTGKTSLGQSLAEALGRGFTRLSLGGVRDEAEIRGHRRTYVGALPGKIISAVKRAGTRNPVLLLDEIDKLGSDFRGDPSSALLEVLDPEQNRQFVDHYLEIPFDLSEVLFVTTANSLHTVPPPLRDRMEIIEIPGYADFDKVHIAQRHLVPKQLVNHGLKDADIRFYRDAILEIVHNYTLESGVRNLDREIASIIRKMAREAVENNVAIDGGNIPFKRHVRAGTVKRYLGPAKRKNTAVTATDLPGFAVGLAWTENGGTVLPVETSLFPGTGKLILTGNLGDVMKESAQAALTYIRSRSERFGIRPRTFSEFDVHIHVPEGAIPKDGPSAGVTITTSILSAFSGTPLAQTWAMSGEITLTGRVLPVGGIKEKVLAAHRRGITNIVLPADNRVDVEELPRQVRHGLDITYANTIEEALERFVPES